jgi:hypothetical protein
VPPLSRTEILALVERSPACVAAHDRDGWLALFSDEAAIEDPVGSPAAPKSTGVLARFWDAFIAPNQIRFDVRADHTFASSTLRDALIHTTTPSGVSVDVEAYLEYRLAPDGQRVERMRAFWSLRTMVLFVVKSGPRAWFAMTGLFANMLRHLGFSWVFRYLASLWRTVGPRGADRARAIAEALSRRDDALLATLFAPGAAIERAGVLQRPEDLLGSIPEGSTVTIEAPVVAGYHCAFRYSIASPGAEPTRAIGVLSFDPASLVPVSLTLST